MQHFHLSGEKWLPWFHLSCNAALSSRTRSHNSNCQCEIHQCRRQGIRVEMTSHTPLSKNRLLVSGHAHTQFEHVVSILLAFVGSILTSTLTSQIKEHHLKSLNLRQQLYLFQQVAFTVAHCLVLFVLTFGRRFAHRLWAIQEVICAFIHGCLKFPCEFYNSTCFINQLDKLQQRTLDKNDKQ